MDRVPRRVGREAESNYTHVLAKGRMDSHTRFSQLPATGFVINKSIKNLHVAITLEWIAAQVEFRQDLDVRAKPQGVQVQRDQLIAVEIDTR